MAHKTFISYKYSEARQLRDDIIDALGEDAMYYNGENGFSDDMSSCEADTIKKYLADMMFDTGVTIVILSPHMNESKWIPWEIEYCLKHETRKDRTSHTNGVVGVIMKVNGSYDWLNSYGTNCHGSSTTSYNSELIPNIIFNNHFNSKPPKIHCSLCKTYDSEYGSYIEFVDEDTFLANPSTFINRAYDKSENDGEGYDIKLS